MQETKDGLRRRGISTWPPPRGLNRIKRAVCPTCPRPTDEPCGNRWGGRTSKCTPPKQLLRRVRDTYSEPPAIRRPAATKCAESQTPRLSLLRQSPWPQEQRQAQTPRVPA